VPPQTSASCRRDIEGSGSRDNTRVWHLKHAARRMKPWCIGGYLEWGHPNLTGESIMTSYTPLFTLVSALAGAGAYAHEAHEPPAEAAARRNASQQAAAQIHHARVEIYCGHNASAMAGIRTARERLRASASPVPAESLAALDQAAWLTLHDQYVQAEQALEAALAHLPPSFRQA
jgi:hypothetical protein